PEVAVGAAHERIHPAAVRVRREDPRAQRDRHSLHARQVAHVAVEELVAGVAVRAGAVTEHVDDVDAHAAILVYLGRHRGEHVVEDGHRHHQHHQREAHPEQADGGEQLAPQEHLDRHGQIVSQHHSYLSAWKGWILVASRAEKKPAAMTSAYRAITATAKPVAYTCGRTYSLSPKTG